MFADVAVQTDSIPVLVPPTSGAGALQLDVNSGTNERRLGLGTKEDPVSLDDDDRIDNHQAISDDEMEDTALAEPTVHEEDKFFFGSVFEKVEEYDHHLDEPNPWHPDLAKALFHSQIIGFRWMTGRHSKGGGLIGDKVGCGKILFPCR